LPSSIDVALPVVDRDERRVPASGPAELRRCALHPGEPTRHLRVIGFRDSALLDPERLRRVQPDALQRLEVDPSCRSQRIPELVDTRERRDHPGDRLGAEIARPTVADAIGHVELGAFFRLPPALVVPEAEVGDTVGLDLDHEIGGKAVTAEKVELRGQVASSRDGDDGVRRGVVLRCRRRVQRLVEVGLERVALHEIRPVGRPADLGTSGSTESRGRTASTTLPRATIILRRADASRDAAGRSASASAQPISSTGVPSSSSTSCSATVSRTTPVRRVCIGLEAGRRAADLLEEDDVAEGESGRVVDQCRVRRTLRQAD
jgi:hypothetical protein